MREKDNFWKSWRDRLTALRNVPPVLKIVWESGPGVVTFGIISRLFAGSCYRSRSFGSPVESSTSSKMWCKLTMPCRCAYGGWWGLSLRLPIGSGIILGRAIDYSDSLLADAYTRHVSSIRVMKHAAELDLLAYERSSVL